MNNFSPRARQALQVAEQILSKSGGGVLGAEHLLCAILSIQKGIAYDVFLEMKIDIDSLQKVVLSKILSKKRSKNPTDKRGEVDNIFTVSQNEAKKLNQDYVGTEHILLALVSQSSKVKTILRNGGVDINELVRFIRGELTIEEDKRPLVTAKVSLLEKKTPILARYCRDLVYEARNGLIGPILGRDEETGRVIKILCRKTKNNPLLVGPAGVGKTALLENLALKIVNNEVPIKLLEKRVMLLDLFLLLAGTKYRGDFEQRIKALLDEINADKNIILAIDEIHTIIGAGTSGDAGDVANMLKPALSRGEISCIGATTEEEYYKYIEKDAALERRFQVIWVEEPTEKGTLEILNGVAKKMESYHGVTVAKEMVEYLYQQSKLIKNRKFPDKGIDILDEACVNCASTRDSSELIEIKRGLMALDIESSLQPQGSEISVEEIRKDYQTLNEIFQRKLQEITPKELNKEHIDLAVSEMLGKKNKPVLGFN